MKPEVLPPDLSPELIDEAVRCLQLGQVIGLPTETVYGLAADGTNPEAVDSIFRIKGRPKGHPLILHLGDSSWLDEFTLDAPEAARILVAAFWPGPLTLVLKRSNRVPDAVTGGLDTVAVRVPGHALARKVIVGLGRPVAAPSANRFGAVSPTTRQHVLDDLGDAVSLVLDGGPCEVGLESTIVDLSRGIPRLLRPGGVSQKQLEEVLGVAVAAADEEAPAAPGTLESHYAPKAQVHVLSDEQVWPEAIRAVDRELVVGVLTSSATPAELLRSEAQGVLHVHRLQEGARAAAHDLYEALRALDQLGCELILTSLPPPDGLGAAVADRLKRAAAPRPHEK